LGIEASSTLSLVGKPVALIGASTGRVGGTVQSQGQLRISLAVIGADVLPSAPVLLSEAHTRFTDDALTDDAADMVLGMALGRFLLTPVAITTATLTTRPPSRTFIVSASTHT